MSLHHAHPRLYWIHLPKSRRSVVIAVILIGAFAGTWWRARHSMDYRSQRHQPAQQVALLASPSTDSEPANSAVSPEPKLADAVVNAVEQVAPEAAVNPIPVNHPIPAEITGGQRARLREQIDDLQNALRSYREELGWNPVGTNSEITRALLGDNLKLVSIPIPAGSSVNENGELCDSLGTPYFFHQLAQEHIEIRSAGPDRELWTGDDVQR
jgi:hypothetical protein